MHTPYAVSLIRLRYAGENIMKIIVAIGLLAPWCSTASLSQTASGPVVATMAPQAVPGSVLPTNTELLLRLDEAISSKKAKVGKTYALSVANDVMLGNFVVIPKGTPATASMSYRTGKGSFGKSAKVEIDMQTLNLNGRTVPIGGHYRQEGRGNTGATVGTVVAAGVFAAFVTGRSAEWPQGSEFKAFTKEAIPVVFAQPGTPPPPSGAHQ